MYWRKPVRERYALLRQRHKGDLEYEYLYARSLLGSNSAAALRLFKTILEKTFVNVWATWCGPCPDLQVLTFSVDENPGVLEPFLKPLGFRFPVLLAKFYVDSLVESLSIPRNWIIGPDGVLLKEQLGFGRTDIWIEEVLRELQ